MTLQLADDRPPIPPADLILRVSLSFVPDDMDRDRRSFDLEGLENLRCFERALAAVGRSFEEFERMLDFGCGCGRFVRHFGPLADRVEIHGTDVDSEMIAWLRSNVPYGHFDVAPPEPPLPYPEHNFDLVINHSVFSHLDAHFQDLWLGELQRITRPGALLLLTVEGQSSWNRTAEASERAGDEVERWRAQLASSGFLFISDDSFVGSTHPDFYHSAVHAPWYVFEHWSRFFDIAAYIPDGSISQDLIVLRRRPDGAPQPRPITHRAAPEAPALPTARPRLAKALTRLERVPRKRLAGPATEAVTPDERALRREINMLRVGLYEQGQRISVIAAQLRDEIEAVRNGRSGDPT